MHKEAFYNSLVDALVQDGYNIGSQIAKELIDENKSTTLFGPRGT